MQGYIKDYRKELDSDIWRMPPLYHRVWQYLKYMANHEPNTIPLRDGSYLTIKTGQHLTSYRNIADGVSWVERNSIKKPSTKTIKNILGFMQEKNMIQIEHPIGNSSGTLVTIVNYGIYQMKDDDGKQLGNSKETVGKRNNNDNNDNKISDINITNDINSVQEKETPQEETPRKENKTYKFDERQMMLAKLLFKKIRENNPAAKEPNLESWANTFRLMMDRDRREGKDIQDVILWSQQDSFWYKNILSAEKLRKQFDRLFLQMQDDLKKRGGLRNGINSGNTVETRKPKYDFSRRKIL